MPVPRPCGRALLNRGFDAETARLATDIGLAVLRLTTERWMAAEHTDFDGFAEALSAGAADLLAVAADTTPPQGESQS
ncbi:hypothetical protein ACIP5Y_38160 [Nocardia sp. NPDC088792]|uniref:hypothetical protein n=1 Tax=Nocardia sp. NPDC088792 TaxID=3364332 RepID=UPI003803398A